MNTPLASVSVVESKSNRREVYDVEESIELGQKAMDLDKLRYIAPSFANLMINVECGSDLPFHR